MAALAYDAAHLVVLQVPVSTTFLNGRILCDVQYINASTDSNALDSLTCMTRPHLATDASSDDAMARDLEARDTQSGWVVCWQQFMLEVASVTSTV